MNFMDPFQGHLFPTQGLHVVRGGDKTCRKRKIKQALEALKGKEMGIPSVSEGKEAGGQELPSDTEASSITGVHLAPLRTESAEIFKRVVSQEEAKAQPAGEKPSSHQPLLGL